jgi:hypothetical protein
MPRSARTLALLFLLASAAGAKDLRTAMIRLVPETDWQASPRPVAVTVETAARHEKASEFGAAFDKWVRWAFPELDYPLDDAAATRVRVTVEEIDLGNAALRWTIGFGAGKSYVRGRVLVEEGGATIGSFAFTARPKGVSPEGMAKEVAPAIVLKLHKGDRDAELHEPNAGTEEKESG